MRETVAGQEPCICLTKNLKTETKPDGSKLDYSYDESGNKTQLITTPANGSSQTTTYSYDQLNRLESVTDTTGTTSYGYDKAGNRKSVSYPNGSSQVYTYDTLNRLTLLQTYNGSGALMQSYTYTLHPTGRRTAITESSGRSTTYSYDTLYRMTGESIVDAVNGNHSATYSYDKVGNRQQSIVNGITTAYTYDDNDRLTQTGGISYSHDNNGNTLTETDNGVTTTYVYNSKNHLVSSSKNGVLTRYRYNPDGIRHQQSTPATTTDYLVDQNRDYAQVLVELENSVAAASYSYGDDLISQSRAGVTSYYHYDGLGSTRALSDASGAMTDSYDYEAFGEVLSRTRTTENDYLFTGEQYDTGLGQYYLRARYYDQGVGRFTSIDTYGGRMGEPVTLHKYLYANADPVSYTDPTGHFSLGSVMSGVNVAGRLALNTLARGRTLFSSGSSSFNSGAMRILNGSKRYLKNIAKRCKRGSNSNPCNYAKGLIEAETKIRVKVLSIPNSRLKRGSKPWRIIVINGAYDVRRGRGTAATNGPVRPTEALQSHAKSFGLFMGQRNACGTRNTVGRCAEWRAAGNLTRSGSKVRNIRWTSAYYVDKGEHGFAKIGNVIPPCGVCSTVGFGP